ncbi:unnamed protein product [Rotaria magnacalcarata]|uniref:Uncharacterized protein n=1 Tax=Rotaria magnacalcarata TaxID=392030 RepID=A0A816RTL3_9BILA|nr:unnamed protein product [Rotaria magnacalcarata]
MLSKNILIVVFFIIRIQCEALNYSFVIRSVVGDPDGYSRPVIIVYDAKNAIPKWDRQRPFPAPLIRARNGEILEIQFTNMLRDQSTSIHFHGLHMLNNPWMDGVEMITQCPIHIGETFTYRFNLTQSGTFWYHSHSHQQYADGLIGPIIIDPKLGEQDPILERYPYDNDSDHSIMLQEWYHESWQDIMTGYQSFFNSSKNYKPRYPWPPTSLLINGRGRFDCHTTDCNVVNTLGKCNETIQCLPLRASYFSECQPMAHDLDEFHCHNGKYVRLRLINAASSAPLRFWIDQHPLLLVARDSLPIEPYEKSYIAIPAGQRLDVIVRCNQNINYKYNMYVSLLENVVAGMSPNSWMNALLVYPNSTVISPPQLSPESNFTDDIFSSEVDTLEEWQINGRTFISPSHAPLLQSIYFDKNATVALPTPTIGHLGNSYETYIEYLEYGKVYEVLLVSNDAQPHSFHLHGYVVNFTTVGTLATLTSDHYDECNEYRFDMTTVKYDRMLPPYDQVGSILSVGDSFTIPSKGYVVFRFKANNPGPWLFHCHMEWHISPGLALVFSIGHQNGQSYHNLISNPPVKEFFLCGDTKQRWSNFYSSKGALSSSMSAILLGTLILVDCFFYM